MTQKHLFIDGGSHLGESFEHFRTLYPLELYDYLLVEPNRDCFEKLTEKYSTLHQLRLINKAIFTYDGTHPFFSDPNKYNTHVSEHDEFSNGCSLLSAHNSKYYQPQVVTDVACVDILTLLQEANAAGYTDIVLKLDVEGAELDILERCIQYDQLKYVQKLIVEFHSQYSSDTNVQARENQLIKALDKMNINLQIWH
jgi:FkbM family methyltransferase